MSLIHLTDQEVNSINHLTSSLKKIDARTNARAGILTHVTKEIITSTLSLDRTKGKLINITFCFRDTYFKEFEGGKMIGNQIFDEKDLADYQRSMQCRRLFVSNLAFNT